MVLNDDWSAVHRIDPYSSARSLKDRFSKPPQLRLRATAVRQFSPSLIFDKIPVLDSKLAPFNFICLAELNISKMFQNALFLIFQLFNVDKDPTH